METSALAFPGMGPVPPSDVLRFLVTDRRARALVDTADDVLGCSLTDELAKDAGDYTEAAQVSFLICSLALAQWACDEWGVEPVACAGPSFGGKAAAVFSGALDPADGIRLTLRFARCLDGYFAEEWTDLVTVSCARLSREAAAAALDESGAAGEVTCTVDDDLLMITLAEDRVDDFGARVRAAGGLPMYVMRPPLHSPRFTGLRRRMATEVTDRLAFRDPVLPVVSDHDGSTLTTADGIRELLLDGCVRPVSWPVALEGLRDTGARRLVVAGQDSLFARVGAATSRFDVHLANARRAMQPRRRASVGV